MADTVYRVSIQYKPDTREAEGATQRLEAGFSRLKDLVLGAAAAFGISTLAKKIFELHSAAEDTRIAIAGMMQAGGAGGLTASADDFAKAMGMSGEILKQMRKDARDLPGEFEDLVNVFRGSLGGGQAAGQSVNSIEHMAARVMAVSKTLGIDSQTAGREMAMMLEGRAGAHNALFMRLHNQIKMTGHEFNALTASEKWAKIDEALKGYDPAVKAFGNTWSAVESTTEDYLKQLFRVGTAPVFEWVKRHLQGWNQWFERNQERVEQLARTLGGELAEALEKGWGVLRDTFDFISTHKDALIAVAEAYAAYRVGSGLAGMLGAGTGLLGRGMGAVGSALGAGNPLSPMATLGERFVQLAGATGLVVTALGGLYAVLQYGAGKIDEWHKEKVSAEGDTASLTTLLMAKSMRDPENAYRTVFNRAFAMGAITKEGSLDAFKFQNALSAQGDFTGTQLHILARNAALAIENMPLTERLKKFYPDQGPTQDPFQAMLAKQTVAHHVTNITNNNHIVQTIENANDPDRVLVKTREALEQIFRHPVTGGDNRFATLRY